MVLTGGTYDFKHSTFANYWSFSSRNTPSILLNNLEDAIGNIQLRDLQQAVLPIVLLVAHYLRN